MVAKLQKLKSLWIAKICLLQRLSKAQFSRELLSRHETYVSLCVCVWREREREGEREREREDLCVVLCICYEHILTLI